MESVKCASFLVLFLLSQLIISALIEYIFGTVVLTCLTVLVAVFVGWVLIDCWWRSDLDERTLSRDLELIGKAFDIKAILFAKETYTTEDVGQYYAHTTDLDYRALELCVGPGMHSELRAPHPILNYGGHTRQAAIVLMEVSSFDMPSWMADPVDLLSPVLSVAPLTYRRVLEVGSGKGYCTLFLAGMCKNVQFYGVDRVARHVQLATEACVKGGYTNADFECADAVDLLSNAPESVHYDVIFGVEALCYLDTPAALKAFVTQAAKRLSHRGGRLVVVDGFRSASFDSASEERRTAMQLSECGFRIRRMPSKAEWMEEVSWVCLLVFFQTDFRSKAKQAGLHLIKNVDLTGEVLPFWRLGWRIAITILRLIPFAPRLMPVHSAENLLSVATTAHAMVGGTAEYGVLVFRK